MLSCNVRLYWVKRHSDICSNNIVDALAKDTFLNDICYKRKKQKNILNNYYYIYAVIYKKFLFLIHTKYLMTTSCNGD